MGFMYQHITAEHRVQIGLTVALCQGTYGLVTGLARELETSRKFVYGLADRVRNASLVAVAPRPPGPAAHHQSIVVDRCRLDRAIVTLGLVAHASQRAISDCISECYDVEPSLGYVNAVLQRASKAATTLNQTLPLPLKDAQVEADELFALGKPNLVAVDHPSLLILSLSQPERCDAAAWQTSLTNLLDRGVDLKRLGSDGGKALEKAVAELPGVEHQLDRWHVLRRIGRVQRALEQVAYKAIGKEWTLEKKASGMKASHAMGGYVWDQYEQAIRDAEEKIQRYEQMCILSDWAREAFEAIDLASGRIRSRQECLEELTAATELMRGLGVDVVRKLADYLDESGPAVLNYVEELGLEMQELIVELGEEGVKRLLRECLLEREASRQKNSGNTELQMAYKWAHMLALLHWGKGYKTARARVVGVLRAVMRGSSLAECVNSWLRPYADLMKGLREEFLALFVLYRNSRVFKRGKRVGHSPMQLAGIETPQGDWLDWLGLGQAHNQPQPLKKVRCLPKTA